MMQTVILAALVAGTLGVCYGLVVKVALQAGKEYPARVKVPALIAAIGVLASAVVQALQLVGVLEVTSPEYQIALVLGLATTLGAMWMLAIRL